MKLFIEDLDLKGKRVLMRVDFNVPLDDEGKIIDSSRIDAALPSIRYVLSEGGALVLMSHLGRPSGEVNPEFSLSPCAAHLSGVLNQEVKLTENVLSEKTQEAVRGLKSGQVVLLENLRFYLAEEHPDEDPSFAQRLADYGDLYVNEAFSCSHRKHSSIYNLAKLFPGKAAMGYQFEKEIRTLGQMMQNPARPFFALIGGSKISTKIGLLKSLLERVDALMIGGAMANTFLVAKGIGVGASFYEKECTPLAREILELAKSRSIPIILPIDCIAAERMEGGGKTEILSWAANLPERLMALDIGPKTVELFSEMGRQAKTVLWNGPVGVYEIEAFAKGSEGIAQNLAASQAQTILCGGDTAAVVQNLDLASRFSYISTGGGAALEFIQKGTLIGLEALSEKAREPVV